MDFLKDFIIPLMTGVITTWGIISVFAVILYNKTIPDEEKRKKIITGYFFMTISIVIVPFIIILLSNI